MAKVKSIEIVLAQPTDVPAIIAMAKQIPEAAETLIGFQKDLPAWVASGHSLVAKTTDNQIIGHQGCDRWQISKWFELRTAMVLTEYRGGGLNTSMKRQMITQIRQAYDSPTFVGFTEAASKSRGILIREGFSILPMPEVPDEFFTACEKLDCWKKIGGDPEKGCGCRVYILRP